MLLKTLNSCVIYDSTECIHLWLSLSQRARASSNLAIDHVMHCDPRG